MSESEVSEDISVAFDDWMFSDFKEKIVCRYARGPMHTDRQALAAARMLQDMGQVSIITFRRSGRICHKMVKV